LTPTTAVSPPPNHKKSRVVSHLFTGSLAGIGKLPALAGWYIRSGMYGIFCTVRFSGSSPQKGGLVHQKGGRSEGKRGSRQMYDTEGPYRVFLRYWLGCDFFRPMPFTKDGVRLRTIFCSAKMTIRALFSPKNTILLCRYADTHTK
jgi:hypothetical protein